MCYIDYDATQSGSGVGKVIDGMTPRDIQRFIDRNALNITVSMQYISYLHA